MKKVIHAGRFLDFVDVNGWEYVERRNCSGVVAIVATTEMGEIILIEQHRRPVGASVIELPAGLVGDEHEADEDPAIAARRELIEETGYDSNEFVALGRGPSSAGLTSEVITFFAAKNARRVGSGGGVGGEEITIHIVPKEEAREWLASRITEGQMIDPKVWAGIWLTEGAAPRS